MRTHLLRHVVGVLSFGVCLAAQGPTEMLKAEAWNGSFSYHTSGRGSEGDTSWQYQGDVKGTVALDKFVDNPSRFVGSLDANVTYTAKSTEKTGRCSKETEFKVGGVLTNDHKTVGDAELVLHDGGWQFRVGKSTLQGTMTVRRVCGGVVESTATIELPKVPVIPYDSPNQPYPDAGPTLSATYTVNGIQLGLGNLPPSAQSIKWEGDVTLQPSGDLILEVDSPDYERWRPSAKVSNAGAISGGDPIEFTATVKHKSGKPAGVEVDRMEWELVDTSREPGVSINYPINGDDSFDLRFDPLSGQLPTDADKQKLTSADVKGSVDHVRVVPIDWGGWSVLKVTAYLKGGLTLRGRFKGSREDDVRLPKRSPDSLIADVWKKDYDVSGFDSDDDENDPVGDGQKGDGLTLYEEYRSVYQGRSHWACSPSQKDYFIVNHAGPVGTSGWIRFNSLTGVVVHPLIDDELSESTRIVNANHKRGPHNVDQHGVLLYIDPESPGVSRANGGPGTPADITFVGMTADYLSLDPAFQVKTTAHELCHTVNVWHHGEGDLSVTWLVKDGTLYENTIVPGGPGIRVKVEDGTDQTAAWVRFIGEGKSFPIWRGTPHGQHSGFEDCVMRYAVAEAYSATANPSRVRYRVDEPIGAGLCTTGEGVTENTDRQPQPRYYAAAAGRGNCRAKIRVTDRR